MILRTGDVRLRRFVPADTDTLYRIRNHASVRARMRDPAIIPYERHCAWVETQLITRRALDLFLVEQRGEPVGIALLRNERGDEAEIGVMIVEAERRRLAAYKAVHLLGYYAFEVKGLARVLSYVPRHSTVALDFNRRCGLVDTGRPQADYHELVLTREVSRTYGIHRRFRSRYPIAVDCQY